MKRATHAFPAACSLLLSSAATLVHAATPTACNALLDRTIDGATITTRVLCAVDWVEKGRAREPDRDGAGRHTLARAYQALVRISCAGALCRERQRRRRGNLRVREQA